MDTLGVDGTHEEWWDVMAALNGRQLEAQEMAINTITCHHLEGNMSMASCLVDRNCHITGPDSRNDPITGIK